MAVLAIDPSSPFSGGAILGDRVRMTDHAADAGVFIRSMATRGTSAGCRWPPRGGAGARRHGWPWVLIETVGVGQVEVEVAGAADTTVVVVNPGWGDAVQANKAGLLEIADVFVINKADRPGADETRRDLERMLDLTSAAGWRPPIVATTATGGDGVADCGRRSAPTAAHLESTRASSSRARAAGCGTSWCGSSPRCSTSGRWRRAERRSSDRGRGRSRRRRRPVDGRRAAAAGLPGS